MKDIGYFIDIERFIKWLHSNREFIGDNNKELIKTATAKEWLRYGKFPSDFYIKNINEILVQQNEKPFEKINIAELLICANNSIDINKGQQLTTITSTGKKVLNLLLLGRVLDENNRNGFFTVTKIKDPALWEYLSGFNKSSNKGGVYYYYPGRTVSLNQLKSVGKGFKNGIKETAIPYGIRELMRVGLVLCVDKNKELYKLNFEGCKKFLEDNK